MWELSTQPLASIREREPETEATIFYNLITIKGRGLYKGRLQGSDNQCRQSYRQYINIIYKRTEKICMMIGYLWVH